MQWIKDFKLDLSNVIIPDGSSQKEMVQLLQKYIDTALMTARANIAVETIKGKHFLIRWNM
jgi:hypothetical protein